MAREETREALFNEGCSRIVTSHLIHVAFGTNQGDLHGNIQKSLEHVSQRGIHIQKKSSYHHTKALVRPGSAPMPDFLNGVFEATTDLSPQALLRTLKDIEKDMGRTQKGDWSPRIIDLDLLLYDNLILNTPELTLPHPEMTRREFVLGPLCELVPGKKHPVTGTTYSHLLRELQTPPGV